MNAKVNSKKAKQGKYSSVLHHAFYLLPCLVGGILMGLTTAPVSAWPLAWIALVPLWVAVVGSAPIQNLKSKIQNSLVWGIGYHGLALFWITGIHPMTWMGVPWLASIAIAFFCWTFITLWGAALVTAWGVAMAILNSKLKTQKTKLRTVSRVLIGVALWCALEYFWSLGSLWWTSLSYTQSPHNLAILHLGQISGPTAVTAAIVAVNGLIAEAWINRKKETNSPLPSSGTLRFVPHKTYLAIATGLLISLHILGFALYSQPLNQSLETALKVGIIQGNVPNEIKLYPDGWRRAIEGYTEGYKTLAASGVEAVLTPETALPFYLNEIKRGSFYSAILENKVVAWLGAFGQEGRSITNSLFTITGTGEVFSRYSKAKLVPLGEFIPFEEFFGGFIDRLSPLDAHLVAGSPTQLFDTPFGRAIVGICYESVFAQHFQRQAAAGGQFIITASNNAHYSKEMPAQHHAQDVMRAIETDRWAARATNTGYSGIVDPHGRTIWLSGINSYEVHADTIYRRETQTLYVRWGDWLTPLLLVVGAIALVISTKHTDTKTPIE
jgi:apolipoprotein N-acyltransferase